MFTLYNLLLTFLSPLWVPWMWLRTRGRKEQPNWQERMGNYSFGPDKKEKRVWFHAVSVGEVVAALPILAELRQVLPDHKILLSVTTSTGHQTARDKAAGLYDYLVYFPIDVARFQLAALQRVQPKVVAIMETELWLNFLWAAKTFGAKTLLINGRISDRSFPRSMKVRFFYKTLLAHMDRCLMQTPKDMERIKALGAPSADVLGNCKFDQALPEGLPDKERWREELGLAPGKTTIVVGSIRAEEFEFLGTAVRELTDLQWVIAPRHIEKSSDLLKALPPGFERRSEGGAGSMILLDSYGELDKVYAVADIAVVGGGFADLGGQNLIQPLGHGLPVLHGPHMQNFRDVAAMAVESAASEICRTPQELVAAIRRLAEDGAKRQERGAKAVQLVRENAGASRRYAEAIADAARATK